MAVEYDLRLVNTSTILVAGPSLCGKTVFTRSLLDNHETIFSSPFQHKFWFSAYKPEDDERLLNVKYSIGLPDSFEDIPDNSIIVLDDLMSESNTNKALTNLVVRGVHHRKLCVIFLTQNLFQDSREHRTRCLNSHYTVVFKNPRNLKQINTLASQMFPKNAGYLIHAFHDATRQPYGYLFIDTHQSTPDVIRFRANILPHEAPMTCYFKMSDLNKV